MDNKDIRWIQRFHNYRKALARLTAVIDIDMDTISELEKEGFIQRFEYTYELAWKTLQDFVVDKGYDGELGKPNTIIVEAARIKLIDEKSWKLMTKSRNQTSHTYDEDTAGEIALSIVETYHGLFIQLETRLQIEKINQEKAG